MLKKGSECFDAPNEGCHCWSSQSLAPRLERESRSGFRERGEGKTEKNEGSSEGADKGNETGRQKRVDPVIQRGFEPDVNRTRNLLIWSQTRYHCATDPLVRALRSTCKSSKTFMSWIRKTILKNKPLNESIK